MAQIRSSPLMVLRRSRWHLSLALQGRAGEGWWVEAHTAWHPPPAANCLLHHIHRRRLCGSSSSFCRSPPQPRNHSLAGDEGDELRQALLHRLLGVLCNLGVARQRLLHDAADVGNRQEAVLLPAHTHTARGSGTHSTGGGFRGCPKAGTSVRQCDLSPPPPPPPPHPGPGSCQPPRGMLLDFHVQRPLTWAPPRPPPRPPSCLRSSADPLSSGSC